MPSFQQIQAVGLIAAATLGFAPLAVSAQPPDDQTMLRIKHELTSGIPVGGVAALRQLRDARNVASDTPLTAATEPQPTQSPQPVVIIEQL